MTLHDPSTPDDSGDSGGPLAGSFPVFLGFSGAVDTGVYSRVTTPHPPPRGCGRHGCLFEGHDSTSTPPRGCGRHGCLFEGSRLHIPPRAHTPRPETPVAFGSTYTALHCVTIRWGRSPYGVFPSSRGRVRRAFPYNRRSIVDETHTHRRPRVGPRRRRRPARADGCATSRVCDDRSRAMSLAFDEFGRPFIIIKVRARPRRARRRRTRARARERATTTTTTTDPSIIHPRARVRSTTREGVVD